MKLQRYEIMISVQDNGYNIFPIEDNNGKYYKVDEVNQHLDKLYKMMDEIKNLVENTNKKSKFGLRFLK
jgi:hypothetical protein